MCFQLLPFSFITVIINCNCIKACPLGAIGEESFDSGLCLSYISQKKGELTELEIDALSGSGMIWGCDICQEVCPCNKELPETNIEDFKNDLITRLTIDNISNREFKEKFGDRAFAWRGKNVILRNQRHIYNRKQKKSK